jgi:hypothetical protein
MIHTYDEAKASEVGKLIQEKYFPLLTVFYEHFKRKIDE